MKLNNWVLLACCFAWNSIGAALPAKDAQRPILSADQTTTSLLDITIDEVISLFEHGSLTSVELVAVS